MSDLRKEIIGCALPAALESMGDRWSFLILRAAFSGLAHFEEFQSELGIARNILASRLARLASHGILERAALASDRRKVVYTLTAKGCALLPAMVALRQWGESWETGIASSPTLIDQRDGRPVRQVSVQAHDGRVVSREDLAWAVKDGAGGVPVVFGQGLQASEGIRAQALLGYKSAVSMR